MQHINTLYTYYGDWFGIADFVTTQFFIGLIAVYKRNNAGTSDSMITDRKARKRSKRRSEFIIIISNNKY